MPAPERWLVAVTEYAGLTSYTGGIGRHYAALLPALVRLGIAVDLVVFADGPALPAPDLQGVTLVGYLNTRKIPRTVLLPFRAIQVRRAYRRPALSPGVPSPSGPRSERPFRREHRSSPILRRA